MDHRNEKKMIYYVHYRVTVGLHDVRYLALADPL